MITAALPPMTHVVPPARRAAPLLALVLVATAAAVAAALPEATGAINDFANLLSDDEEQRLTRLVEEVEQATSAEIAVATVDSLDGLTVEDYATQLFAAWGVGQRGRDNGVLIVVAPNQREMRIEVGYGLEAVLPDGLAGQVIRETFLPAFRSDDYARGIVDGTERVAAIVRRNETLTEAQQQALAVAERAVGRDDTLPFVLIPFLGLFVAIGFGMIGAGAAARAFGPILFGLFFGGMPLGLSAIVDMPLAPWILGGVALVAVVVGVQIGRRSGARSGLRGSSGKGGWVWGGSSSGGSRSSSGGSRSSGGFGGGRSGGGGASGRW
jgi:uncharacterized protein